MESVVMEAVPWLISIALVALVIYGARFIS